MSVKPSFGSLWAAAALLWGASGGSLAAFPNLTAEDLYAGRSQQAVERLTATVRAEPDNDVAKMELGFAGVVRALEKQARFIAARDVRFGDGSLFGIPIRGNATRPDCPKTTYADLDAAFETFVADLEAAERTLAGIKSKNVSFVLELPRVGLDVDGDGKLAEFERVAFHWAPPVPGGARRPEQAEGTVRFDYADTLWLRSYCFVLSGAGHFWLSYDLREFFEVSGHLFVGSPEPSRRLPRKNENGWEGTISDIIGALHTFRGKVKSREHQRAVWEAAKQVVRLGRETWDAVEAETDDDREWLPSPKQRGVHGMPVTAAMVKVWREALEEIDLILDGKRLLPHPLVGGGLGVDLKAVLLETPEFDFVMFVHGDALRHALKKGPMTDQTLWLKLREVFGDSWPNYLVLFN